MRIPGEMPDGVLSDEVVNPAQFLMLLVLSDARGPAAAGKAQEMPCRAQLLFVKLHVIPELVRPIGERLKAGVASTSLPP